MASLNEISDLANPANAHLLDRLEAAIVKAGVDISNELQSTGFHSKRFAWAEKVLASDVASTDEAKRSIWLILQNVTIADQYNSNPSTGGTIVDVNVTDELAVHINFLAGADDSS